MSKKPLQTFILNSVTTLLGMHIKKSYLSDPKQSSHLIIQALLNKDKFIESQLKKAQLFHSQFQKAKKLQNQISKLSDQKSLLQQPGQNNIEQQLEKLRIKHDKIFPESDMPLFKPKHRVNSYRSNVIAFAKQRSVKR